MTEMDSSHTNEVDVMSSSTSLPYPVSIIPLLQILPYPIHCMPF